MASKLAKYLEDLGKNPTMLDLLRSDPHKAMAEAGLEPHEKEALKSADPAKIRAALRGAKLHADIIMIVVVAAKAKKDK